MEKDIKLGKCEVEQEKLSNFELSNTSAAFRRRLLAEGSIRIPLRRDENTNLKEIKTPARKR